MSGRPTRSDCLTWIGNQSSANRPSLSGRLAADREDAAVESHVADLHLVRDAAQRDHRPVLELERRQRLELLDRPRQIADDERVRLAPDKSNGTPIVTLAFAAIRWI